MYREYLSFQNIYYGEDPLTTLDDLTHEDLNNPDQRVTELFFQKLFKGMEDICPDEMIIDWRSGIPEPDSKTLIVKLLHAQAKSGSNTAMMNLAEIYHDEQKHSEAEHWYQQALKHDHPHASVALGRLYLEIGKEESAKKLFRAEPENPDALNILGQMYTDSKQYEQAVFCILRAAAYKNGDAINHLAILQLLGLGIEKNEEVARENFFRAMSKPHYKAKAMSNYALMLYLGLGGEVNLTSAKDILNEAGGFRIPAGYYHLGLMYEKGKGVELHEETAENCYLAAAKLGSSIAMHRIGCWYRDRDDIEKAIGWWKKAANKNHAQSCFELWKYFRTRDLKKGREYLNLAKKLDNRFEMKKGLTFEDGCLYWIE